MVSHRSAGYRPMTPNTTVLYRITATHPNHPRVELYLGPYSKPYPMLELLTVEGYTVTLHRVTTTIEDVTNAR